MPRIARVAVGGICYHVINRGNGRMKVFRGDEDYAGFVHSSSKPKNPKLYRTNTPAQASSGAFFFFAWQMRQDLYDATQAVPAGVVHPALAASLPNTSEGPIHVS